VSVAVKLITTGGTIATVGSVEAGGTRAALRGAQVAELASDRAAVDVDVEEVTLSSSWALTPSEMLRIALTARDVARSGRWVGVVVTHGTTTLEYTAFLVELINDSGVPIVFTGAMRTASVVAPDGPRNLADAVRVASDRRSRGHRCLVVFAGHVLTARSAWKMKRDELDAFISLDGHPGAVDGDEVRLPPRPTAAPLFDGVLEERVSLVKVYPGITSDILRVATTGTWRGAVLEALAGAGGVPQQVHGALREAAARMPVVVSSRAPVGRVPSPPTGGTGEPLAGMGLLSAGDLTSEKAWLLLMAALGQARTDDEARELFGSYASIR
jgi:L-asparaginase